MKKIDKLFKKKKEAHSGRSPLNVFNILLTVVCVIFIFLGASFLLSGNKKELTLQKQAEKKAINEFKTPLSSFFSRNKDTYKEAEYVSVVDYYSKSSKTRKYTSSQLIKSESIDLDFDSFLPKGSTVHVRLSGNAKSLDTKTPVIAYTTENTFNENDLIIPKNTKLLGKAYLNKSSGRLCIDFDTLLLNGSNEIKIDAFSMMNDGSSCLKGIYKSGKAKKHSKKFLGNFISGLANGLKDRSNNHHGESYTDVSVKNGALNGASESFSDWANSELDENISASVLIPSGTEFKLYFNSRLEL